MGARSPSLWLLIAALAVAWAAAQPGLGALAALSVLALVLLALRWAARREGRLIERARPSARLPWPSPEARR